LKILKTNKYKKKISNFKSFTDLHKNFFFNQNLEAISQDLSFKSINNRFFKPFCVIGKNVYIYVLFLKDKGL